MEGVEMWPIDSGSLVGSYPILCGFERIQYNRSPVSKSDLIDRPRISRTPRFGCGSMIFSKHVKMPCYKRSARYLRYPLNPTKIDEEETKVDQKGHSHQSNDEQNGGMLFKHTKADQHI